MKVPISDSTERSLIWTPDASRATALIGNTPDAFGQTWHLPIDDRRLTYNQLIALASEIYDEKFKYSIKPKFVFSIGSLFNTRIKELLELLPRYRYNNTFDDSKFRSRFPNFIVTTYRQGIERIKEEQANTDKKELGK